MKKISLNKIHILIKNNYIINRSIPIILFVATLILSVLIGAMPVSDVETRYTTYVVYRSSDWYESYTRNMTQIYEDLVGRDSVFSIFFLVVAFVLAFLSVASLTGFTREKSASDFYHSLSLNRGEIFLANYLTALINSGVTIILSQLSGLVAMNLMAGYKPLSLWELVVIQTPIILSLLLFLALFLAIAMIASVASGSVFAFLINYGCINFLAPLTILIVAFSGSELFNSNLLDYLNHFPHLYAYTSPFIRYITDAGEIVPMGALDYIAYLVATLALIALGIYLYGIKKNENASNPLPFRRMVRPLQYILTFVAILLGATFFELITTSLIWCIIGGLLALLVAFVVYNAFVNKSFVGVMKHSRHMAYMLILTIIFGAIFVADIFKIYKEPTPDFDKLDYCTVYISSDGNGEYEWHDFYFDNAEEISSLARNTIALEGAEEDIERLYNSIIELRDKQRHGTYTEKAEENHRYLNVSMNINCKGDAGNYHASFYVDTTNSIWQEAVSLAESFIIRYPVHEKNIETYDHKEVYE